MATPDGTHVRLTSPSLGIDSFTPYPAGTVVVLETFVDLDETEADDGKPFYWASGAGGINNVVLHEGTFEVVFTPEQAEERTLPTMAELVEQVQSSLHSSFSGAVDVMETQRGEADIEVYGKAENGLYVSFKVTISEIERADG